ncbi:MAG: DMT family transporter [Nitrospirota bacterium]|nr:MAG: DMT family transporter [Nitrospirota bacterium]
MALLAFAGNSVLCRVALGESTIDASTFTFIRLLSGAVVLLGILQFKGRPNGLNTKGDWSASFMLFLYAVTFSFAYLTVETGTGALILFGSVQITIILMSLISGNRLLVTEWIGVFIAFGGFVYLVLPGVATPSVVGFALMAVAGIAWGMYTLKGRSSTNPLSDTTFNFLRTTPFVLVLIIMAVHSSHYSFKGIVLAVLSGGVASGIGYTIWYMALSGLSAIQAAVVQLFVPIIAALGGVIFMAEPITLRLSLSSLMILGGILLVFLGRAYLPQLTVKSNR